MSAREHLPYRGDGYEQGFRGRKLLVVGESHYCELSDDLEVVNRPSLTRDVIQEFTRGNEEYKFFRTLRQISSGVRGVEPEAFWSSIAFCNFVQRVMVGIADRPSHTDFEQGWAALNDTINELQPDLMFVFSRYAWTNVMAYELNGQTPGQSGRLADGFQMIWRYKTAYGRPLYGVSFNHPSRLLAPMDVWRAWAEYAWAATLEDNEGNSV